MQSFPGRNQSFKFMPLEVFRWYRDINGENVLIGEYHPGMTYNCTTNPIHDALREQCREWVGKGLIKIIQLAPGQKMRMVPPGQLGDD